MKIDIFNHDSMSTEIDSGFGGEEVVLLDFSDKNIYENMMRQEQKRREEAKKKKLPMVDLPKVDNRSALCKNVLLSVVENVKSMLKKKIQML
jgi:hypothetical protein